MKKRRTLLRLTSLMLCACMVLGIISAPLLTVRADAPQTARTLADDADATVSAEQSKTIAGDTSVQSQPPADATLTTPLDNDRRQEVEYVPNEVTITYAGPGDGIYTYNLCVNFKGADSYDVQTYALKMWYECTVGGKKYRVERTGRDIWPSGTNANGELTGQLMVPENMGDHNLGAYGAYVSVITRYKDGKIAETEPYPLTKAPYTYMDDVSNEHSHGKLAIVVPAATSDTGNEAIYEFGYGVHNLIDDVDTHSTFINGENGIYFDTAGRVLTISGSHNATIKIGSKLIDGFNVNKIILSNAAFESLNIESHKPIPIEVYGTNTGYINLTWTDIFIEGMGSDAVLKADISASGSDGCVIMSNLKYEGMSGHRNSGSKVISASALVMDGCTATLINDTDLTNSPCISLAPTSYLDKLCVSDITEEGGIVSAGCIIRNSSVWMEGCGPSNVFRIESGDAHIVNSDVVVRHNNVQTLGINSWIFYVQRHDLFLKNNSTLTVDFGQDGGTIRGVTADYITIDKGCGIGVNGAGGTATQHTAMEGIRAEYDMYVYGTADVTLDALSDSGCLGIAGDGIFIDGGLVRSVVRGNWPSQGGWSSNTYGVMVKNLVMKNNASMDVVAGAVDNFNQSPDYTSKLIGVSAGDIDISDSIVSITMLPRHGIFGSVVGIDYNQSARSHICNIKDSIINIGIHNHSGKTYTEEAIEWWPDGDSSYAHKLIASGNSLVMIRTADEEMLAEETAAVSSFAAGNVELCTCGTDTDVPSCMGADISAMRRLTVQLPRDIAGKKSGKPIVARLMVKKDGIWRTVWNGYPQESIGVMAVTGSNYTDAELQVVLNGKYITVASKEADFSNSSSVMLDVKTGFRYVSEIIVRDTDGKALPADEYIAAAFDAEGTQWSVPGLLKEGSYTVKIKRISSNRLYDVDGFNDSGASFYVDNGTELLSAEVGGLALLEKGVKVSGRVTDKDDAGKGLKGIYIVATQELKNGIFYSASAVTDSDGAYSLMLYGKENAAERGSTIYVLSGDGCVLMDGDSYAKGNMIEVPTQDADVTGFDFIMKKQSGSIVNLTWTLEAGEDEDTRTYLEYLPKELVLAGTLGGKALADNFESTVTAGIGVYDLWNGKNIELLLSGSKDMKLQTAGGSYDVKDGGSFKLDGNNTATAALKLTVRAGIVVKLGAVYNKAMEPHKALWYDASGKYIGASSGTVIIDGEPREYAFACPKNVTGSYTAVFAPASADIETELDGAVAAGYAHIDVALTEGKGKVIDELVGLTAASLEVARYITQPNSSVSAPQFWTDRSNLIAVAGHIEADGNITGALLEKLWLISGDEIGVQTAYVNYVTADTDGDGQAERYEPSLQLGVDQLYIDFDKGVALPLDFTVYITPNTDGDVDLTVKADIRHNDKKYERELIGSVDITAPGAVIYAPARTASETITVEGTAFGAGENITIYDGGVPVCVVVTAKKGKWKANVTLAGCNKNLASKHTLTAVSEKGTSAPVDVIYNSKGAALLRSGMYINGTYSDADGSYVWRPDYDARGCDVVFEAVFDNADAIAETVSLDEDGNIDDSVIYKPVVFWVTFLNGEIAFYEGKRQGEGVYRSENIKAYSPITAVKVVYDNTDDAERGDRYTEYSEEGYSVINIDYAEFMSNAGEEFMDKKTAESLLSGYSAVEPPENATECTVVELMNNMSSSVSAAYENFIIQRVISAATAKRDYDYMVAKSSKDGSRTEFTETNCMDNGTYRVVFWEYFEELDTGGAHIGYEDEEPYDTFLYVALTAMLDEDTSGYTYYEVAYLITSSSSPLSDAKLSAVGLDGKGYLHVYDSKRFAMNVHRTGKIKSPVSNTFWQEVMGRDDEYDNSQGMCGSIVSAATDGKDNPFSYWVRDQSGTRRTQNLINMADKYLRHLESILYSPCYKYLSDYAKFKVAQATRNIFEKCAAVQTKAYKQGAARASYWVVSTAVGQVSSGPQNNLEKLQSQLEDAGVSMLMNHQMKMEDIGLQDLAHDISRAENQINKIFADEHDHIVMESDSYHGTYKNGVGNCLEKIKDYMVARDEWGKPRSSLPNINQDPSGYIYEAVASNRVSDATVTLYYQAEDGKKDMEQVESGDDMIVGAQNPLITDAEGHYEWFVPSGRWFVTVEKDGYSSSDSSVLAGVSGVDTESNGGVTWLMVPPPQMEVNIGLTSTEAPYIRNVFATTDGVEIEFSKYMNEDTLKAANFGISGIDGQSVKFTVEKLNSEANPLTGTYYTSKVLLKTAQAAGSLLNVTVKNNVTSYAGTAMIDEYSALFIVKTPHTITVEGATASLGSAVSGMEVTVTADRLQTGIKLAEWECVGIELDDEQMTERVITFIMPDNDVSIKAVLSGVLFGADFEGYYDELIEGAENIKYSNVDTSQTNPTNPTNPTDPTSPTNPTGPDNPTGPTIDNPTASDGTTESPTEETTKRKHRHDDDDDDEEGGAGWVIFIIVAVVVAIMAAGFIVWKKFAKGKNGAGDGTPQNDAGQGAANGGTPQNGIAQNAATQDGAEQNDTK